MANSDKNILITPNTGQTETPKIEFTGGDNNTVTARVLDDGTLSFEGSAGQLFSISDSLSGTIFSVNDVSGIPSIEVDDDGTIRLAEFSGNVLLGTDVDNGTDLLQVDGSARFFGSMPNARTERGVYIGLDSNGNNPQIQLQGAGATGPHIDFCNGNEDFDARIILTGNDTLNVDGAQLQVGGSRVFADNYHPNADRWTTARTLSLTGDVTGSVSWDGSGNASLTATVANDSHSHSNYEPINETILHQHSDINTQNWNDYIDGTEASWRTVLNHSGSNRPSDSYTYGTALSFSKAGQAKFQLYAPETGSGGNQGLWYRTGWNTAYRQWARIWDSTNDGSGSGLDADLLDGQHASAFQPAANELTWIDQATGNYGTIKVDDDRSLTWAGYAIRDDWVFMSNGSEDAGIYNDTDNEWAILCHRNAQVELYHNGSSKLQTTSSGINVSGNINDVTDIYLADQIIHSGDTNTYMQFHAADQWRVVTGGAERLEVNNSQITSTEPIHAPSFHGDGSNLTGIDAGGPLVESPTGTFTLTGNLIVTGDVTSNSDERLKENIETLDNSLGKVMNLRGVSYDKDGKRSIGLIAQEVEKELPELVSVASDEEQTKSVAYGNMTAVLLEAMKEQQKQIEALQKMVKELSNANRTV